MFGPLSFLLLLGQGAVFFAIIPLIVAIINLITARVLNSSSQKSSIPKVAVLIPARNEENNIGSLLDDLQKQRNLEFEVFVLDDNSEDNTASILSSCSQQMSNLNVLDGKPLPKGWLGKPWACHQLSQTAKGFDILIFLDADVRLSETALVGALHIQQNTNADLLSVFPTQVTKTFGERLFVTTINFILLSFLPLRTVERFKMTSLSAANGQCMLFTRSGYNQIGGHESVKNRNTEDLELSLLIQQYKLNLVVALGGKHIFCRMYPGSTEALNGISRSYYIGFGAKGPGYPALHALISYIYVLPFFFVWWQPIWILPIILGFLTKAIVAFKSNRNIFSELTMHIPQVFALLFMGVYSFYQFKSKSVTWKGRNIHIPVS